LASASLTESPRSAGHGPSTLIFGAVLLVWLNSVVLALQQDQIRMLQRLLAHADGSDPRPE